MGSPGIIPEEKLEIWNVFWNLGPEGEEILKTAKLAHAFGKGGFVVTMTDQTYHFLRDNHGGVVITRIPELCHVRVKEFLIGSSSLALTENGQVFAVGATSEENLLTVPYRRPFLFSHAPVTGSLTGEEVVQAGEYDGALLALTLRGDVHHCDLDDSPPILIPKEKFGNKKVISVACNRYLSVALTEDGELFEWKSGGSGPQKSALSTSLPIKKIAASKSTVFALTFDGTVRSCDFFVATSALQPKQDPVWALVPHYTNVQDIATCATKDVCVVELKTNICSGRFVGNRAPWRVPFFAKSTSLDECFAEICQTSYRTFSAPVEPEPRKLCHDISNLWRTKKNTDVTFSVEGKLITAHKLVLTMRSEYFEKMFSGEWVEAEGGSVVYIKDTKHEVFGALLFYIYHDWVPFLEQDYENLAELMTLADSYCEVTIRRECEKLLMQNIDRKNAFFLLRSAAAANALNLEKEVTNFILKNRLFGVTLSSDELVGLLGRAVFDKLAMASLCR